MLRVDATEIQTEADLEAHRFQGSRRPPTAGPNGRGMVANSRSAIRLTAYNPGIIIMYSLY